MADTLLWTVSSLQATCVPLVCADLIEISCLLSDPSQNVLYNTTKLWVNEFSSHGQVLPLSCQVYFDDHSNSWRWQTALHPSFQITAWAIKPIICHIPARDSFRHRFMCCYITLLEDGTDLAIIKERKCTTVSCPSACSFAPLFWQTHFVFSC